MKIAIASGKGGTGKTTTVTRILALYLMQVEKPRIAVAVIVENGGSGSAVAAAIEWAAFDGGAAVINNSWGPPDGNPFDPSHTQQLWPRADGDRPGGVLPLVLQEALAAATAP